MSTPLVGRLAPSPTGRLHVGHARSFLAAWWSIRARGGRIVLRIEDLDVQRSRPEHTAGVLEDLRWLGLDWDGEPFVQSAHTDALERALLRLTLRSLAYPCVCSRKDQRSALGAPHAADEAGEAGAELRYPGTCRDRFHSLGHAEMLRRQSAGLRLRVPPGVVRIADALAGPFAEDVSATVGDFLLARRDGAVAYQLAVVVHDAEQGVSEVVRGNDLLASTPRQWLLQEALGLSHPRWFHLPLVVDDAGERLAKRSGGLTLASLRERGADPRRLVAWAAHSLGMDVPSSITPAAASAAFDLERIPRAPVRFTSAEERALLA